MKLTSLAGNAPLKRLLAGSGGQLSHAYVISGPAGSGRHTLAGLLAQALVCTGEGGEAPCGLCPHCRKAAAGIHPDVIRLGAEKDIRVDDVRALRADAHIRPNEAARKVYVLERADQMNQSAQNALLKLLEEGPSYAAFLLLAENQGGLLQTVRSRCVELTLVPLSYGETLEWLRRRFPQEEEGRLARVAAACEGLLGRGEELLRQEEQGDPDRAEELALAYGGLLCGGGELALMELAVTLEGCGREELAAFYDACARLLRDALVRPLCPGPAAGGPWEECVRRLSGRLGRDKLLALSRLVREGREGCAFFVGSGHSAGWLAARTWEILSPAL